MVHQAKTWGWKALSAKLLLAPVVAGTLALPVVAQTAKQQQAPAAQTLPSDPNEVLKIGRKLLATGDYDKAIEMAKSAAVANTSGRWGLFADTPDSLMKDAVAARTKADQVIAAGYMKEANELRAKSARTEAERLAVLDAAAEKIDKAILLGLAPDWNPFAEKPEAVKREIDAARAKLRKSLPVQQASARAATPTVGSKVGQAKFESESLPLPSEGGAKTSATTLLKDGRGLMAEGKLVEARKKFVDAAKTGATFNLSEDNPDKALQDLLAKGKVSVDELTKQATAFTAEKNYAKAEAALKDAKATADSLGLWSRGIELELDNVVAKSKAKELPLPAATAQISADVPKVMPGVTTTDSLNLDSFDLPKAAEPVKPAAKPVESIPTLPMVDAPKADKTVELPKVPTTVKPVETLSKKDEGQKLLDEATKELKKGDLDAAQKLAIKVHNSKVGLEDEAQKLMVAIDAERGTAKTKEAVQTLEAANVAFGNKQYEYVATLLSHLDKSHLPKDKQDSYDALAKMSAGELAKIKAPTVVADVPKPMPTGTLIPSTPTNLAEQSKAASDLEYTQLKSEAVSVQSIAIKAFDKGDTDVAVQALSDFSIKVKASKLSASRQKLILDPVETKLESFRLIKRQVDSYTKDAKEKTERMQNSLAKSTALQQKQEEIAKRVRDIKSLMEKKDFAEAEKMALQAKTLDPDNETLNLVYEMAKRNHRQWFADRIKAGREEMMNTGLTEAETQGPTLTNKTPIQIDLERYRANRGRPDASDLFTRHRTEVERDIEMKLDRPLKVEFKDASLREVIEKFRDTAQINLSVDEQAIVASGLDLDKVKVNEKITQPISMRSVMQVILEKNDLQHVVENNVVTVTTAKKAKGRMYTKVFSVMELVTPIPDYGIPETSSLEKTFQKLTNPQQPWVNSNAATSGGMGNGQLVSGNQPWTVNQGSSGIVPSSGGVLNNQTSPPSNPAGNFHGMSGVRSNYSEQLMKLIKGMVRSNSWEESGGSGKLAYYDIGGALVVNQTADVITEVNNLLDSLRRLQDLSVAVEVRIISLSESFYERIGVDFQMNIKTKNTGNFERGITTGVFRPTPFLNDISTNNVITGWNPAAGGFTPDLDVPIRPNTYGNSVPPFGGYPGNGNGGLNLGLAFLNDIQVFMFLEAAAGDRRANVMQAPKVTVLNGGGVFISIQDTQFFTLGLQVFNVGGQFVYLPQNTPTPIGISLFIQATVSSDRRFVRLAVNPTLTELTSATVPLFPVTAFITPVFEGGSQGTPIPFTQFFQQPSFSTISIQTNVVVPDGGTVLMGGLKTMSEGRNESGPPVLSNIPYLNRLFRNTGIGRETKHMMIMVTPRIIITSEEEAVQTGAAQGLGNGN
jgi:type II secretory pathway component GspD/PulD (secretin)